MPPRVSTPDSARSRGFTLIEGLIAITIMGIVAGLGLPQLNGIYERQKLTNTANEVVTQIKAAQNMAFANNQGAYVASPPLTDCVSSTESVPTKGKSYVDGYRVEAKVTGSVYSYSVLRVFRATNAAGGICPPTRTDKTELVGSYTLPANVQFSQGASSTGTSVVAYKNTTGRATTNATVLKVKSTRFSTEYAICVKGDGRAFVSDAGC